MNIRLNTIRLLLLSMLAGTGFAAYGVQSAYAQDTRCEQVVRSLRAALDQCSDINNNWACYGYPAVLVSPTGQRFQRPSDRLPLEDLETVNTDANGAVFMYLYAGDQQAPVAMIAFGGAELLPVGGRDYVLDITDPSYVCPDTPPGIAVHTETGKQGSLTVNGVTITLKSTAFITVQDDGAMTVVNLEGSVSVSISELGVSLPLPVGYQVEIAMKDGVPVSIGEPTLSPFYDSDVLRWLAPDGLAQVHNSNVTSTACGGTINFGETISSENFDSGQECLYHFCANAGEVVSIQMSAADAKLDPWIDLRLPDGKLWSSNNDLDETEKDAVVCNRALPETSCDYTIVARPHHNIGYGSFTLSLNKYSACTPPEPRCEVITRGLNLRSGPGTQFPRMRVLAQDAQVKPLESYQDTDWVHVRTLDGGDEGWVSTDTRFLACEQTIVAPAPPPLPIAPPATTTNGDRKNHGDETCKKCSPYGTP